MKNDISTREDICKMVDSFYGKIRQDDLLGHIFNGVIQDNWPLHLEKMYGFWETILLNNHTYSGSPFAPHAFLDLHKHHFDRWLSLFNDNLDEQFMGDVTEDAKVRASKMAEMFLLKIDYYRKNNTTPLI